MNHIYKNPHRLAQRFVSMVILSPIHLTAKFHLHRDTEG